MSTFILGSYLFLMSVSLTYSLSNTRCFPQYDGTNHCYMQPSTPLILKWAEAQEWCKNIGGTLPILNTWTSRTFYWNAMGYFGLASQTAWIGGNSTFDLDEWRWLDGSVYSGPIANRVNATKTHAYMIREGTSISFVAASPFEYHYYITQSPISEVECSYRENSLWAYGNCYIKSGGSTNSWSLSSPLAIIKDASEMMRWLDDSEKYWVGLRCTWWNWQDAVSDNTTQLTDNLFGYNLPNNTYAQCLASHANYQKSMYWLNKDCSLRLPFICQLPTIVYSDTTDVSATSDSRNSVFQSSLERNNFLKLNYDLDIGLGVGLGGGLFLLTFVLLFILASTRLLNNTDRSPKCFLFNPQKHEDDNQNIVKLENGDENSAQVSVGRCPIDEFAGFSNKAIELENSYECSSKPEE